MLVSPTEPKLLRDIGTTSSTPEKYGVDFLFPSPLGLVGVQRKEIKDLVASLRDGRLGRELAMMKHLPIRVLLQEGTWKFSEDGYSLNVRSFTRDQAYGVLFSAQMQGVWSLQTDSITDTSRMLRSLERYLSKVRHSGMGQRPKPNGEWGTASNRDWMVHLYQSFPGVGAETAGRMYDELGVALAWTVGEKELREVRGVGKMRAKKMWEALQ